MNNKKKSQLALLDAYLLLMESDDLMLLCDKKPKNWSNRIVFIQALIDELLFELADVPLVSKKLTRVLKTPTRKYTHVKAKPSKTKKGSIARM